LILFKAIEVATEYPQSDRLHLVVNAVVDALTSQVPRDRYVVGLDARLVLLMSLWLPTFAMDAILRLLSLKYQHQKGPKERRHFNNCIL